MKSNVLTVVAEDLSPAHLLAAIKHWAAKFEQEILNIDGGPDARGSYEFEHDGKPTAVHWNPVNTFNHMQPIDETEGSDSSGAALVTGGVTLMTAGDPVNTDGAALDQSEQPGFPAVELTEEEAAAMQAGFAQQAADVAAAKAEKAPEATASEDETAADVAIRVAPDLA